MLPQPLHHSKNPLSEPLSRLRAATLSVKSLLVSSIVIQLVYNFQIRYQQKKLFLFADTGTKVRNKIGKQANRRVVNHTDTTTPCLGREIKPQRTFSYLRGNQHIATPRNDSA